VFTAVYSSTTHHDSIATEFDDVPTVACYYINQHSEVLIRVCFQLLYVQDTKIVYNNNKYAFSI
jgi:hypothetical protein